MTALEQIRALALQGVSKANAEATIGRRFTSEELTAYRAAATVRQLRRAADKAAPKSTADRVAEFKARRADVGADFDAALAKVNRRRRARCEKSLVAFARTYCCGEGGFLEVPPPAAMCPILEEMQTAVGDTSTPYHIRIARGHGKTSFMKCAAAWVLSYGVRRYIVSVSADANKAAAIISDLLTFFTTAPEWCEDFPEIAVPLRRLGGAFQRAKSQTCHGANTNIRLSAKEMRLPFVADADSVAYPAAGAILAAVGLTGNARGLVRGSMRPDLVLLDDLQNDIMARSEERVLETAQTIRKSFMGLAGHRRKIAAIMTSTPIEPDDLSETFAADKSWKTTTYPMLSSFPKCYGAKDGDLWREYADIYRRAIAEGRRPHVPANRFYIANRREMDAGAAVLNPANFDRKTEKSAIQHAMNILIRDGKDAFMSEYQMQPPRLAFAFEITARLILSRVRRGVAPNTIPDGSVLTVAATDINPAYGLTTAIVTFDVQLTAFVTAYHVTQVKISDNLSDTAFDAAVYGALTSHGREIAALGVPIDLWGVDAGGKQFAAVTRFTPQAEAAVGIRALSMLGRAGQNWNPNVRSRIRAAKNGTVLCRDAQRRQWLAWNADEHKERAQRAWLAEPGAAGGLSLFDGNANHYAFAAQVANEKLVGKVKVRDKWGGESYGYKWRTRNPHDYGDCLAMAFALAGHSGLSPDAVLGEDKPAQTQTFEVL